MLPETFYNLYLYQTCDIKVSNNTLLHVLYFFIYLYLSFYFLIYVYYLHIHVLYFSYLFAIIVFFFLLYFIFQMLFILFLTFLLFDLLLLFTDLYIYPLCNRTTNLSPNHHTPLCIIVRTLHLTGNPIAQNTFAQL